jgi:hypothetical protein
LTLSTRSTPGGIASRIAVERSYDPGSERGHRSEESGRRAARTGTQELRGYLTAPLMPDNEAEAADLLDAYLAREPALSNG